MALRLAKEGYGGGDPGQVLRMDADLVLMAIQYITFQGEYERAYVELNKPRE